MVYDPYLGVCMHLLREALTLSTYQYTIEHIKGTSNLCADCMSRLPMTKQSRDSAEKIHVIVTYQ